MAYALGAWIIIEAGSVLLPTFGASDTVFRAYVIVVIIGFLVSLVFAWIFEITPEGVKLEKDIDRTLPESGRPVGLTNFVIIGLLIIALGVSITFNVTGIRGINDTSAAEIMAHRRSIAVLPFENRSNDPANMLFTDGLHDELLTRLANFGTLKVISRTSVMEYRNTSKKLPEIGQELGVDTLLEGTVQQVGNKVRINVQLIDAASDEHLWAQTYDSPLTEDTLFAVQSQVSGEIAGALQTTLMPAGQQAPVDIPTKNLRAYSLYTTGRDKLYTRRLDNLQQARTAFEQAIDLDPNYAEAHVALAECLILLAVNHQVITNEVAFAAAQEHLDEALDLNDQLSDAYATLGLLKTSIWIGSRIGTENLEAEAAFEQALALNPNNAQAYMWFANLRDSENRTDEAIGYYHRSMQLDPLGRVPYNNLPTLYAQRGENEYALRLWLQAIEIHPDWPTLYQLISVHLASLGRLDEAIAWERLFVEYSAEAERMPNVSIGLYAEFGDMDRAKEMVGNLAGNNVFLPLAEGYRLLLDGDFGAASDYMVRTIEAGSMPAFGYGIASDFALLAGDLKHAREYMLVENPVLKLDAELEIDRFTVRDVVKLAYIEKQEGNADRARELLNAALPAVQNLPRLGVLGQGVREAQIFALLGRNDDALAALRAAIDAGFRTSTVFDNWLLSMDPYFASIRDDPRFVALLDELDTLNAQMYERVLEAEATGDWQALRDLAGAT